MQRAHKGLKRLTTIRKKTGHTWHFNQTPACDLEQVMIQASMQTGHKLDKQDMVPDARKIMRTWYGTFMGLMEHERPAAGMGAKGASSVACLAQDNT